MNESTRLEYQIAMASVALRGINWSLVVNDKDAGENSDAVMTPVAYAMFKSLAQDHGGDQTIWLKFLHEALAETALRYSGKP